LPSIPLLVSKESANTGGTGRYADAAAFGGGIGRAVDQLGGALQQAGDAYSHYEDKINERHKDETLYQKIALTDMTKPAVDAQRASVDGKGVVEATFAAQDKIRQDTADTITDPDVRSRFNAHMYETMGRWRSQQTEWAANRADAYNREQNDLSLDVLVNRVRTDASSYGQSVKDAENIIAADKGIAEANRPAMKAQARSNLAQARFEGTLVAANSEAAFDHLEADLKDKTWQGELSKEAFARVKEEIKVQHNAFTTLQDQKATAIEETMGARLDGLERIPPDEWTELEGLVNDSHNPKLAVGLVKLRAKEETVITDGKASLNAIQNKITQLKGLNVDSDVATWASKGSAATGGEISASYLVNKLNREYRRGDLAAGKYNEPNAAGTSSARGLFQFTDGTWLDMFQRYGGQVGYTPDRMSAQEILALRGDPQLSTTMAAFYAKENKKYLQDNGVTQVGDTELYLAHFLGPAGAVDFIKALQAGPHEGVHASGHFSEEQIAANLGVFRNRKGTPLTFQQVYSNIASSFMPGKTAASFDRQEFLQKIYDKKSAAYTKDPMMAYAGDSKWIPGELKTDQDFYTQGRAASAAAAFANIPIDQMKPFTGAQADELGKVMRDGDPQQKLQLMSYVAMMDEATPGLGKAAAAQLGEKDTVLGYAASMMVNGDDETAKIIVNGNDKLTKAKENYTPMLGAEGDARGDFNAIALPALAGADPATLNAMFNATKAYYVEKYASKGHEEYDATAFKEATQRILGGQKDTQAVDKVNGFKTLIPPGLTAGAATWDSALSLMTPEEFIAQSEAKLQPIDNFGDKVTVEDVDVEGRFVSIGGGQYKVMMHDDNFLAVKNKDGSLGYFIFQPDVALMNKIAASGSAGRTPPEAQQWDQSPFTFVDPSKIPQ
jgi:hypothetical protein